MDRLDRLTNVARTLFLVLLLASLCALPQLFEAGKGPELERRVPREAQLHVESASEASKQQPPLIEPPATQLSKPEKQIPGFECGIWNVESGDADPGYIAERLRNTEGIDIWGLSEVHPDDADRYIAAIDGEENWTSYLLSETGGGDRLLVGFDVTRFKLLKFREMVELSANKTVRAPLALRLLDLEAGKEFWFINNHLARGKPEKRMAQAIGLRNFAAAQDVPVIVCGDMNFDYSTLAGGEKGNAEMRAALEDDILTWVTGDLSVWTNNHPRYYSILDMFCVNDDALEDWELESVVLTEAGDEVDDKRISDHRPVQLLVNWRQ